MELALKNPDLHVEEVPYTDATKHKHCYRDDSKARDLVRPLLTDELLEHVRDIQQ